MEVFVSVGTTGRLGRGVACAGWNGVAVGCELGVTKTEFASGFGSVDVLVIMDAAGEQEVVKSKK